MLYIFNFPSAIFSRIVYVPFSGDGTSRPYGTITFHLTNTFFFFVSAAFEKNNVAFKAKLKIFYTYHPHKTGILHIDASIAVANKRSTKRR